MTTKINNFWNWFKKNEKAYLFINELDNEDQKNKLLNKLLLELHKYCKYLYFEIGGYYNKDQELVITAEGNPKYFDKVDNLIAHAPKINNWVFIAFKQPSNEDFKSSWGDVELSTEDIYFLRLENPALPKSIGIRIFIKNYHLVNENKNFKPLILKMLDTLLGEKSFSLDIKHLDFDEFYTGQEDGLIKLIDLPTIIEEAKRSIN